MYPLTEDQIHNGEPHRSNFGYAYAKRMLEVYSRAIRSLYGLKYITAVPNNIYGPKDNFDLENSHVIPAMIRKFYEAKIKNTDVVLWGTGEPLREFTYSTDIARALLLLLENYEGQSPINIGTTREFSIKEVSEVISREIGFKGKIIWDTNMPTGQLKKPSSNKKFLDMFPNFCYTDAETGLKKTCKWFIDNYPNIRGVR
jgi:GDP-L-fucose synthase